MKKMMIMSAAAIMSGLAAGPCRAQSALGQLSLARGGEVPVVAAPALPDRFPSGAHSGFGTALDPSYGPGAVHGDYYPFAGDTGAASYIDGPPDIVSGLLSGMDDEGGHRSPLSNGGEVRDYWESALKKYKGLDFAGAYHDIGVLCHLTQDQAVPAHAANINHVVTLGDKFEQAAGSNRGLLAAANGDSGALRLPALAPYGYYQALQDDTRRQLAGWQDPATGRPYWLPSPDAPAPGQDATKGPWGSYPGGGDSFSAGKSPELIARQGLMAAAYTRAVLRSAAGLLPPVVSRVQVSGPSDSGTSPLRVSFKLFDNRAGKVKLTVERPLYGQSEQAVLGVRSLGKTLPSSNCSFRFEAVSPVRGEDLVVITAEDQDGNVTRVAARAGVHGAAGE